MSETTGGLCPVMSHLSSEKINTSTAPVNKASTKDAVKTMKQSLRINFMRES